MMENAEEENKKRRASEQVSSSIDIDAKRFKVGDDDDDECESSSEQMPDQKERWQGEFIHMSSYVVRKLSHVFSMIFLTHSSSIGGRLHEIGVTDYGYKHMLATTASSNGTHSGY
jgi:hypothetical protein